jgi:hypothetical protein
VLATGASLARRVTLSTYVTGFVAVFVLAAGAGLGSLFAAGQLSVGLLALTLAGLGCSWRRRWCSTGPYHGRSPCSARRSGR